jgi:hypothetical protein
LTGRHRHLDRVGLVARNTDHVVSRADVTVEAGTGSNSMYRNSINWYVVVDMAAGADLAKNV